jgi:hypothetical protein
VWGEGFSRAWGNFCPEATLGASFSKVADRDASIDMTFRGETFRKYFFVGRSK